MFHGYYYFMLNYPYFSHLKPWIIIPHVDTYTHTRMPTGTYVSLDLTNSGIRKVSTFTKLSKHINLAWRGAISSRKIFKHYSGCNLQSTQCCPLCHCWLAFVGKSEVDMQRKEIARQWGVKCSYLGVWPLSDSRLERWATVSQQRLLSTTQLEMFHPGCQV